MTNTHINVGGHKITTNKVGQLHNLTPASGITVPTNGFIKYCVINGMCTISVWNVTASTTGFVPLSNDAVPPCKLNSCLNVLYNDSGSGSIVGDMYVYANENTVYVDIKNTIKFYGSLTYPVADDWVES